MPAPKKSKIPRYLGYALVGLALTATLFALSWTGAPFAVVVSLAAAAVIHSLVGIGLELYHNYKKPELSRFDKIKLGIGLGVCAVATLGLMIVFPHIGIPIAGAIAISTIAFGASFLDIVKNMHHFFTSKDTVTEEQEHLLPRDAMQLEKADVDSLKKSITAFEHEHPSSKVQSVTGDKRKRFDESNSYSAKKVKHDDEDEDEDANGKADSPRP